MSSYQQFTVTTEEVYGDLEYEEYCDQMTNTLESMRVTALDQGCFLFGSTTTEELLDFVEYKKYNKKIVEEQKGDIIITGPCEYYPEEEETTTTGWIVARSKQEQIKYEIEQSVYLEANKERIETEKQTKKADEKQRKLEEESKKNKFNWTLPAELRGIVKV